MTEMTVVLHVSAEFAWRITADAETVQIERLDKRPEAPADADGEGADGTTGGAVPGISAADGEE